MKRRIALWAWMMLVAVSVPGAALADGGTGAASPGAVTATGAGQTTAPPATPATPSAAPTAGTPAAPTAAPASGPTAGQPAANAGKMPEDQFQLKVKDLEEKVTDLKEKIYRTKARLLLLQETVIGGGDLSSAKAVLIHKNQMGASFVLQSVAYALDGAPIFTRVNTDGSLDKQAQIEVFNGRIVPGNHQLTVQMKFRGNGFGIFSYLNGYKFNLQSSYTFNAEGGKVTTVRAVAFEKGGFTTDIKDRPAIRFEEQVNREQVHHGEPSAKGPAPGAPKPPPGAKPGAAAAGGGGQ